MKRIATRLILTSGFLLFLVLWVQSLAVIGEPTAGGSIPAVQFLGESGSYEIDPAHNFLVKANRGLNLSIYPGPSYKARQGERVWSLVGDELPETYNGVTHTIGRVEAGCVVAFTIIDDDIDSRINYFRLDGANIFTVDQGMVSSGKIIISEAGVLSLVANDSIGLYVDSCQSKVTMTPTITPTSTQTPTATIEPTFTTEPTLTPTPDSSPTATATVRFRPQLHATAVMTMEVPMTNTPTPTVTPTISPRVTESPTATSEPGEPQTPTPTPTDDEPRVPACLRINFDVGGDHARQGTYVVQEIGGRFLASWPAEEGWQDSGWIYDIDITHESVYVEVWFYPGDGGPPIRLDILNPAPGTNSGWLSRGECHALEVAWSGGDQFATPVPNGRLTP